MKKIINSVDLVEEQMIEGLKKAFPQYVQRVEGSSVIARAEKKEGKVALVSGGGSGHEPAHAGYVGTGMLDAAVPGAVFTSPTPDQVYEAIKAVATDKGVLMIIKNYTGDVMNFEMAADMARDEGITVDEVIVNDDVAVDGSLYTVGRRGVAGTVFVHKITGAKAETGASLEEVKATAQKVIDNVRTMSMAIKPCTVPAAGKPGFELGDDEMEIGIGIHGEPGTHREALRPADEIVDMMMDKILADIDFGGSEVAVMINSCGGTPLMELFIVNNRVYDILAGKGIKVYKTFVGEFMTSLEMEGFSITLLKLDDEMKALLDAPADTPAFKVI
ncbi:MAG: dihydroxyacetone kinase subunit DhaK [Stomatobaculum sp.]|nr:dihydroxyacetone kinase subunit DhaK [Stomatobaculum sp.]